MKNETAIKDLIIINNDRYEGYKTAAEETKDSTLKEIFTGFSRQSKQFNNELQPLVPADALPEPGATTLPGKAYRVWMDVKAALRNNDNKAVLASCEFGEDTALGTYKQVLEHADIAADAKPVIDRQKAEIQQAHDKIKTLRDLA